MRRSAAGPPHSADLSLARALLVGEGMPSDEPEDKQREDPRISVMDWVLGIGRVAARKFRSTPPPSQLARVCAKR